MGYISQEAPAYRQHCRRKEGFDAASSRGQLQKLGGHNISKKLGTRDLMGCSGEADDYRMQKKKSRMGFKRFLGGGIGDKGESL